MTSKVVLWPPYSYTHMHLSMHAHVHTHTLNLGVGSESPSRTMDAVILRMNFPSIYLSIHATA